MKRIRFLCLLTLHLLALTGCSSTETSTTIPRPQYAQVLLVSKDSFTIALEPSVQSESSLPHPSQTSRFQTPETLTVSTQDSITVVKDGLIIPISQIQEGDLLLCTVKDETVTAIEVLSKDSSSK